MTARRQQAQRRGKMQIRHLSFFVTLAREGHFARAADACRVTQPTLSSAIRKLEEDFGVRLVNRGRRFSGLTTEGERVLAWGQQILSNYDSLKQDLNFAQHDVSGLLRLGVIPAAMPVVAFITDAFCRSYPAASVDIVSMTSRQIRTALDGFDIHAGITYTENEPLESVRCLHLYQECYVAIAKRELFGGHSSITWQQIQKFPLCMLGSDMQFRRIVDKIASKQGTVLRPVVVSNSFLAICAHLRGGEWMSVTPHTLPYLFGLESELEAVRIEDANEVRSLGVVTLDREPLPLMARSLLISIHKANLAAKIQAAHPPASSSNSII